MSWLLWSSNLSTVHGLGTRNVWADTDSPVIVMDAWCSLWGQTWPCPSVVCVFKDQVHIQLVTPWRTHVHESIQRVTHACLQLFGLLFYHFFVSGLLFSVTNMKRDSCGQTCLRKASILTAFNQFQKTLALGAFFLFWPFDLVGLTRSWLLFSFFSPLACNFFFFSNIIAIGPSYTFWCGCQSWFESSVTQRSPALYFNDLVN